MDRPVETGEARAVAPLRRVRVLVVDEHELSQLGLRAMYTGRPWVERCFAAGDADIAVKIAQRHQPQLILVDMRVGGGSGLRVARALRTAAPFARIVMMSGNGAIDRRVATEHGANAIVSKSAPLVQLLDVSASLVSGRPRQLPAVSVRDPRTESRLSLREAEVLEMLARGLSNPEIAGALHLSRHTVKQHTSALYRKLGVRNRAQAASLARERGLVA